MKFILTSTIFKASCITLALCIQHDAIAMDKGQQCMHYQRGKESLHVLRDKTRDAIRMAQELNYHHKTQTDLSAQITQFDVLIKGLATHRNSLLDKTPQKVNEPEPGEASTIQSDVDTDPQPKPIDALFIRFLNLRNSFTSQLKQKTVEQSNFTQAFKANEWARANAHRTYEESIEALEQQAASYTPRIKQLEQTVEVLAKQKPKKETQDILQKLLTEKNSELTQQKALQEAIQKNIGKLKLKYQKIEEEKSKLNALLSNPEEEVTPGKPTDIQRDQIQATDTSTAGIE